MEVAIQLFGYLILTFLGVVTPIIAVLLSVFHEGILKLSDQYAHEKAQNEKNIREQLLKKNKAEEMDLEGIQESIDQLKTLKKQAESKLAYLNPRKQILKLFILLFISFLGVILAVLAKSNIYCAIAFLLLSLIFFVWAVVILWRLLGVIIEVKKIIEDGENELAERTLELLSRLVEQTEKGAQYFLKNVYITIDNDRIKGDESSVNIEANKRQEFRIGILNSENRMAKNIEFGFVFPREFIIDKTSYYSIYRDKAQQVVRFRRDILHGNTHGLHKPLIITPIKEGEHRIKTFIKAENVECIDGSLKLMVTKKAPSNGISKA